MDEAAPPAALRAFGRALDRARVGWRLPGGGNIRFEKSFTKELVELLARSGCIAVSGGPEVASDRLLALMQKGVTVAQVARVTRAFSAAGILVHAYLMYRIPNPDRAGNHRLAGAGATALCRRLHPVGLLAPLRSDGAQSHRTESGRVEFVFAPAAGSFFAQ